MHRGRCRVVVVVAVVVVMVVVVAMVVVMVVVVVVVIVVFAVAICHPEVSRISLIRCQGCAFRIEQNVLVESSQIRNYSL